MRFNRTNNIYVLITVTNVFMRLIEEELVYFHKLSHIYVSYISIYLQELLQYGLEVNDFLGCFKSCPYILSFWSQEIFNYFNISLYLLITVINYIEIQLI